MTAGYRIGIDIGGSNIRFVLVKGKKVVKKNIIATPKKFKEFNSILNKTVLGLTSNGKNKIDFLGVAVAGVVHDYMVDYCTNVPYLNGYDFAKAVGFSDPRRMTVDNDARSALWCELRNNRYKKGIVLMLTIGTGIGRAISESGEVKVIKDFEWAEKWERYYQKIQRTKELGVYLAYKLWPLLQKYKPSKIIIGGGVTGKRPELIKDMTKTWREVGYEGNVYKSKSNDFAGAIGAAL